MSEEKKKPPEDEEPAGAPAWMATFSDMMTLLMTFFILIMSFSTMEVEKFKMAMGSLKGAFGILGVQDKLRPDQSWFSPSSFSTYSLKQRSVLDHMEKLRSVLDKNEIKDKVEVTMSEGELFVQIKDNMLFKAGSATLRTNYLKLLSLVSRLFFAESEEITVEGYTDNTPIHTEAYPSNWELSIARAMSVVRYFVDTEHINPNKLSATGFGEFRPLVPNDSPAHRAKNRRVVIRMKL